MTVLPAANGVVGSIPSPSENIIHLGPVPLHMYGLCIAMGVIAAVWLSSKRWEARGGNPDDIGTLALWTVPAGVIGARMYHVATDWKTYQGHWVDALKITNGGLGIPGGVALGVLVGIVVVKRKRLPVPDLLDVVAPALPLAQAIGRFGNWFNQELYGRPTSLPWGLRIDAAHRPLPPSPYATATTFHPTFLYEALWNVGLVLFLLWIERRRRMLKGDLFCLYVLGYAVGRYLVESMRIDKASLILGIRVNLWMAVIVGGTALVVMVVRHRRHGPGDLLADRYPAGGQIADEIAEATAEGRDDDGDGVDDGHEDDDEGASARTSAASPSSEPEGPAADGPDVS